MSVFPLGPAALSPECADVNGIGPPNEPPPFRFGYPVVSRLVNASDGDRREGGKWCGAHRFRALSVPGARRTH